MDVRTLPAAEPRVETGPVRFGDDWTGVFIRGDNAFAWILALDHILKPGWRAEYHYDPLQLAVLNGLRDELAACVEGPVGAQLRGAAKADVTIKQAEEWHRRSIERIDDSFRNALLAAGASMVPPLRHEPMRAWIIADEERQEPRFVVIGTEADAAAKARELGDADNIHFVDSPPVEFSIAVKP